MQLPDHHHSEDSFSSHGTQPAVDENIEVREGERWVVPISAPNPAPLGSAEHPIVVDDDAESLFESESSATSSAPLALTFLLSHHLMFPFAASFLEPFTSFR